MKPQGVLTEQDYEKLASELIDYHDPDNFLDNCERQYMGTNRGFYEHLLKAVKGFIFPESELRRTDLPLIPPPDNVKTEKAVEVVKRRAELARHKGLIPFDINSLQFVLKNERFTNEILPGKTLHVVCCNDTLGYLQGLVPYEPDERDFSLFVNAFSTPHIFRQDGTVHLIMREPEMHGDFFKLVSEKVNELSRADLKEYFFKCLEIDIKLDTHRGTTGKSKFPIMKFIEGLDEVKKTALNEKPLANFEPENNPPNPDFTTARQVLAVLYLLEYCQVKEVDKTQKARFIEFLTGKNYDNIYKAVRSPLASKVGNFRREDLQFIRPFFENLGLVEIVKMINNQLDKID